MISLTQSLIAKPLVAKTTTIKKRMPMTKTVATVAPVLNKKEQSIALRAVSVFSSQQRNAVIVKSAAAAGDASTSNDSGSGGIMDWPLVSRFSLFWL